MLKRIGLVLAYIGVLAALVGITRRGEFVGILLTPVLVFFVLLSSYPKFDRFFGGTLILIVVYLLIKVFSSYLDYSWFLHQGWVLALVSGAVFAMHMYWRTDVVTLRHRTRASDRTIAEFRTKEKQSLERQEHFEEEVNEIVSLFELAREFNECIDLKEIVNVLSKQVFLHIPFERGKLVFLDEEIMPGGTDESPMLGFGHSMEADEKTVQEMSLDQALVSRIAKHRITTRIDSPEQDRDGLLKGRSIFYPLWIFPLVVSGEITAAFWVEGAQQEDFSKFEIIASQLALHVKKVKLYNRVRELSLVDGLTKLFVRRHFLERFRDELVRSIKYGLSMVVIMLDIDHFKKYNDTYGHMVGDVALKQVAQTIKEEIRRVDVAGRYGGEEFAIILPETDRNGGMDAAERIRSRVAKRIFRAYDEDTRLTVSIGITVFPEDVPGGYEQGTGDDLGMLLLKQADQALYQAKEEGRNHVVCYGIKGH